MTLLCRALCADFGYGFDTLVPSLLFSVNRITGGVLCILTLITYLSSIITFRLFKRNLYSPFTSAVRGLEGSSDMITHNHLRPCGINDVVESFARSRIGCTSQIVILGVGYDTRAYGRLKRTKGAFCRFHEVHSAATQNLK